MQSHNRWALVTRNYYMCLTEPGARVTSTLLVGSPVGIPQSPGRISDNWGRKGSEINKRRAALTIAWPCEKRGRTDTRRAVTVARRLRIDRRSRTSYSTRVSSSRETAIGVASRGKQSRGTAIAGRAEKERARESEKGR